MFLLRPGSSDRFEDLAMLYNVVNSYDNPDHRNIGSEYVTGLFSRREATPDKNTILALDAEDRLVGSSVFFPRTPHKGLYSLTVQVHPDSRRQGIGTSLLKESELKAEKATMFVGSIPSFRKGSINFATKREFLKVGKLEKMKLKSLEGINRPEPISGYSLREARDTDSSEWGKLQNEAFNGHFRYKPVSDEYYNRMTQRRAFVPELSLVMVHDGQIIAYCLGLVQHNSNQSNGGRLLIQGLGVRRDHRGRGLGLNLLTEVLARARGMGVEYSVLVVDSEAIPAMSLYRKVGYKRRYSILWFQKKLD